MIDDGVYQYYALKDLATNLYYSGPEEGILNFEIRPTVDKSGRITKFNNEKAARCAIHEMMYVMGDDIYDDDAYDPASYTIVQIDEALNRNTISTQPNREINYVCYPPYRSYRHFLRQH